MTLEWSQRLLNTGAVNRYSAARALAQCGFRVAAGYRSSGGCAKATSPEVDLAAQALVEKEAAAARVLLLVQVAGTRPGASWLFFPHPKPSPDTESSRARAFTGMDDFSLARLKQEAAVSQPQALESFQALELNHDLQDTSLPIAQGLDILQNAAPRMVADAVLRELSTPVRQALPFFFGSVLLTPAPLWLAREDLAPQSLTAARELSDIARPVDRVFFSREPGPDFPNRCVEACKGLSRPDLYENIPFLAGEKSSDANLDPADSPPGILEGLIEARPALLARLFTQFAVCHEADFPRLLGDYLHSAQADLP